MRWRRLIPGRYWHIRLWRRVGDAIDAVQFAWQRVHRGWDDTEVWSIWPTYFKRNAAILRGIRDSDIGHPVDMTHDEWKAILTKIVDAFELAAQVDDAKDGGMGWGFDSSDQYEKNKEQIKEAMDLFTKHVWSMWT